MSNCRYLEFDSTYRNRNEWPLPAEFEIPISQSGRKGQYDAVDPVADSVPLMQWSGRDFDKKTPTHGYVDCVITPPSGSPTIEASSAPSNVVIKGNGRVGTFQQLINYYIGANLSFSLIGGQHADRRIIGYKWLGSVSTVADYAQVTLASPLPDTVDYSQVASIADPTDVTTLTGDPSNPYVFIPQGRQSQNGYVGYIVYNETRNDYRPVASFDFITSVALLDTSTMGPVNQVGHEWTNTDNYSIRKTPPTVPTQYGTNPVVLDTITVASTTTPVTYTTYTTSTSTVILDMSSNVPSTIPPDNYYKNWALRVTEIAGGSKYNYVNNVPLLPPLGESVVINSSVYVPTYTVGMSTGYNALILNVSALTAVPAAGDSVELLSFSYDNLNPFNFNGSLVSQQQNVCHEIKLLNVCLPNLILRVAEGGRIAFYPYCYVTLANYSGAGHGPNIYSNNPNAVRVMFRSPIMDVNAPLVTAFINIDGRDMCQTVKFKPDDNIFFSVSLPNGELYESVLQDNLSPAAPNPYLQISAAFSIRRITNNPIPL